LKYILKNSFKFDLEKMMFLQYWKAVLLVLKLQEFLSPSNICFLVDENQMEMELGQISEIVKTNGVRFLTCQRYVTLSYLKVNS
jgi:hypothetical protein